MDAHLRGPLRRGGTEGPGTRERDPLSHPPVVAAALRAAARAALACALALSACADARTARETPPPTDSAVVVVDAAGRSLSFSRPPARVLSLVPAVTATLVQLGAGGALVGRTDFDTLAAVRALPSVGGGLQPDMERVVSLRPDLVVLFYGPQDAVTPRALDDRGIAYLAVRPDRIADVRAIVGQVGRVMGRQPVADSLVRAIDAQLAGVRDRVAGEQRLEVAFLLGGTPPWVAGPNTFISELLDAAGADNAFADQTELYAPTSLEVLLTRPLDAYVVTEGTNLDSRLEHHARIVEVSRDVESPGTGLGRQAEELARALHPDAYR